MQTKTKSFSMFNAKMKYFYEKLDSPDVMLDRLVEKSEKEQVDYRFIWVSQKIDSSENRVRIDHFKEKGVKIDAFKSIEKGVSHIEKISLAQTLL